MNRNYLAMTEVGSKARSKIKIYRHLTTEGEVYLPPAKDAKTNFYEILLQEPRRYLLTIMLIL